MMKAKNFKKNNLILQAKVKCLPLNNKIIIKINNNNNINKNLIY